MGLCLDRLLAATMLAVAVPAIAQVAPDQVKSVVPEAPGHQLHGGQPAPAAEQGNTAGTLRRALDRLLSPGDSEISAKLKDMLTSTQFERRVPRPADRKAIQDFYAARGYAPLWMHGGQPTAQAKAAIARLQNAAADGLDASDYPTPELNKLSADALAAGDIKLTESVLTYARHLAVGRIAPTRVTADVEYGTHAPDPDDILRKLAAARDVDAAIESYNPPHAGFRALKAKLAGLRRDAARPDTSRIPDGPVLRYGMKDPRIPLLRERLHVRSKSNDLVYDKALYNAVRALQHRHGLKPTGLVDGHVIAAINGPTPSRVIETVLANMERWRWLPRDLGRSYVMVNIPDFTLKVVHDGKTVWHTKIVAGKPQTPTPLVSAPMRQVIVNPSWYVPQSIIQNELLPLYAHDPNIFDRMGLEVKRGADGTINVVQPPGAANALGRIKFAFPNKFQVYLHDTPEKRLFKAERRAFSHGCMRVEDPAKFGEVMLSLAMSGPTPNARQIMGLFGEDEKTFALARPPMVHLTYQTAFVDEQGKLHLDDDLYGFDARIRAILHSDERRIADVPPPQDPKRDLATFKSNQEILRRVERREAKNPFQFFDQLFR
jgi:murein L,D-transpeptidase YcbB/YkuD